MGSNIRLRSSGKRFLETPDKSQRLRVDPENDAYLEDKFKEATRSLSTDSDLTDKLLYLINYFKTVIPYNKPRKIQAFDSLRQDGQEVSSLGTLLHGNAATCWEKAAFFNLVLAEMGIKSKVEVGYKKSTGGGHGWIVLEAGGSKNGWVIDPTWGIISPRSFYESAYNIEPVKKTLAYPKTKVDPTALSKAIDEVIVMSPRRDQDVFKLQPGDLLQKMRIELVGLKVERQKVKEESQKFWSSIPTLTL